MKGVVLRHLGLRTLRTDAKARGLTTGADIMCGTVTPKQQEETIATPEASVSEATASSTSAVANTQEDPARVSVATASNTAVAGVEGVEAVTVAAMGSSWAKKQKWWRPDPVTGTWVPEGQEGRVTTSADAAKSARPTRRLRVRSDAAASLEDKRWWSSMEELPDMDRSK